MTSVASPPCFFVGAGGAGTALVLLNPSLVGRSVMAHVLHAPGEGLAPAILHHCLRDGDAESSETGTLSIVNVCML